MFYKPNQGEICFCFLNEFLHNLKYYILIPHLGNLYVSPFYFYFIKSASLFLLLRPQTIFSSEIKKRLYKSLPPVSASLSRRKCFGFIARGAPAIDIFCSVSVSASVFTTPSHQLALLGLPLTFLDPGLRRSAGSVRPCFTVGVDCVGSEHFLPLEKTCVFENNKTCLCLFYNL